VAALSDKGGSEGGEADISQDSMNRDFQKVKYHNDLKYRKKSGVTPARRTIIQTRNGGRATEFRAALRYYRLNLGAKCAILSP
jgi:hypothetical protein